LKSLFPLISKFICNAPKRSFSIVKSPGKTRAIWQHASNGVPPPLRVTYLTQLV
jgi:hypothetical protein